MIFFFIFEQALASSVVDSAFKDILGHWDGILIHFLPSIVSNASLSIDISHLPGKDHLTITAKYSKETDDFLFFLKKHPEKDNYILISDRYDDDLAELFIDNGYDRYFYLARGLLKPNNDQITLSIEDSTISISVTDQFSSNYTLIQVTQNYRNAKINQYVRLGLIGSVLVAILVGLYKLSDLSDIIPKDEGQNAIAIKQMAMAQERRKQMKEKNNSKSKAKND